MGDGVVSGAEGGVGWVVAGQHGGLDGHDGLGAGRVPPAAMSTSEVAEAANMGVEANIPAVTFSSFGGGEEAKREERMVAANWFGRGGAPVGGWRGADPGRSKNANELAQWRGKPAKPRGSKPPRHNSISMASGPCIFSFRQARVPETRYLQESRMGPDDLNST